MDPRAEAAKQIASLFGDGGANVLSEIDRGNNWGSALSDVPPEALTLQGVSPHPPGERLLARVRDHWVRTGALRPAIAATRGLIRARVERLGREHPDTLYEVGALGSLADRAGRHDVAGPLLEEAWQGLKSTVGGRDRRLATVAESVGIHFRRLGETMKAEAAFDQAYRIRKEIAPDTRGAVAGHLGELLKARGKVDEAIPLLQEGWEWARDSRGPLHPLTVQRARSLAFTLADEERYLEAEPVLRTLFRHARETGDPEKIAEASFELGVGLIRVRLDEEGFRHVEDAIRRTRDLGDPHEKLASRLVTWSKVLRNRGHLDEAEGVLQEAIEAERRLHGDASPQVAGRYVELADLLANRGRFDEALGWMDPAVSILRSTLGVGHPHTQRAAELLSALLLQRARAALQERDVDTAREYARHARTLAPVLGEDHEMLAQFGRLGL